MEYKTNHETLNRNFKFLVFLQVIIVVVSAAFAVTNLKKFFIKKAIF